MEPENNLPEQDNDDNYVLWRLLDHTRFMMARLREKELDEYGLTPEQVFILDILGHSNGTSTINNMVKITQRKHHSISTQIDRMAKQGLVSRKRTPDDFRQYDVTITKRGQTLLSKVTRNSINQTLDCLTDHEKKELQGYLKCLLEKAYALHGIEHTAHFPGE
jgi:DNA-binding MarR family transcriptional regulator